MPTNFKVEPFANPFGEWFACDAGESFRWKERTKPGNVPISRERGRVLTLSSHVAFVLVVGFQRQRRWERRVLGMRTFASWLAIQTGEAKANGTLASACLPGLLGWLPAFLPWSLFRADGTRGLVARAELSLRAERETPSRRTEGKRKGRAKRGESESVRTNKRDSVKEKERESEREGERGWLDGSTVEKAPSVVVVRAVHDINMYVSSAATCPTTRLGQTHASSQWAPCLASSCSFPLHSIQVDGTKLPPDRESRVSWSISRSSGRTERQTKELSLARVVRLSGCRISDPGPGTLEVVQRVIERRYGRFRGILHLRKGIGIA